MTRQRVLDAVREALGRTERVSGPLKAPVFGEGVEAHVAGDGKRGDPALFQSRLESVGGVVLRGEGQGPWQRAVADFAKEKGIRRVFAPSGVDVDGLPLESVDEEVAAREPDGVLGLASADWGVARSGSVVVDAREAFLPCVLVSTVLVLLKRDRIVARLADLPLPGGRRMVVTGPARTADIEKKIVLGAHGPKVSGVILSD